MLFSLFHHLKKAAQYSVAAGVMALVSLSASAQGVAPKMDIDVEALKKHFSQFNNSPKLVDEIDSIISTYSDATPIVHRIDLDLWKLKALADVSDTRVSANFAYEVYTKYTREEYATEQQFGDTMQQIVQAISKTDDLGLSFKIVQELRESVYKTPNTYLDFIIDKSLMEIYIETFDYKRALLIELSILDNADYMALPVVQEWRPSLLNEIAFIYNRLGDGEKALKYLELAKNSFEQENIHPNDLIKAKALNYGNRGRAYLLTGNYAQVEKMGQQVLRAGEELGQMYLMALGHRLIGSAAYNLGDYTKAVPALKAGIELSELHNIETMQKFLYKDYALCLESLGDFEGALLWQKKHFLLEMEAQEAAASARSALSDAEFNAIEAHNQILQLKHENQDQREIHEQDLRVKRLLMITILSLLVAAAILAGLINYLRKSRKNLIKSEQKAKIANKAKSEFLANMSHEIRTPMNGVLGMAQVLQKTPLTEQQNFYVDTMYKSGESLLAIINDILDFSKLEADKLTLTLEPCNLENVVQNVVDLMTPRAHEKNLGLHFQIDPDLPKTFMLDSSRLGQVISNLIGNSIKFTTEGSVKVRVTGKAINRQKVRIKIDVADTGIGIQADKLQLIFEKFTQAEGSTTRTFGGTGLGLTISRKIAEAMNGTLKAMSTYGVGSIFSCEIPLQVATSVTEIQDITPAPVQAKSKSESKPQPKPQSQHKAQVTKRPDVAAFKAPKPQEKLPAGRLLKVLIAEDDEVNCTVIKAFLNNPQIDLHFVGNGKEAIKLYKTSKFDIILMDVSMPIMDGISAMKIIRQIESVKNCPRIPIICLSAHAMVGQKEAFLQAGMDDYLSKPLKRESLINMITFWVRASKLNVAKTDKKASA